MLVLVVSNVTSVISKQIIEKLLNVTRKKYTWIADMMKEQTGFIASIVSTRRGGKYI
jgi:hypothetical protein